MEMMYEGHRSLYFSFIYLFVYLFLLEYYIYSMLVVKVTIVQR